MAVVDDLMHQQIAVQTDLPVPARHAATRAPGAAYDGFRGTAGHRPVGLRGRGGSRTPPRRWAPTGIPTSGALAEPRDGSRPRPGGDAVAVAGSGSPKTPGRPRRRAAGPSTGATMGGCWVGRSCCRCRRGGRTSRSGGSCIRRCGGTATPARPPAPSRAVRSATTSTRSSAVVRPGNTRAAATVRRNGMEWVGETGKYFGLPLHAPSSIWLGPRPSGQRCASFRPQLVV